MQANLSDYKGYKVVVNRHPDRTIYMGYEVIDNKVLKQFDASSLEELKQKIDEAN